jgi:hypothetical protein
MGWGGVAKMIGAALAMMGRKTVEKKGRGRVREVASTRLLRRRSPKVVGRYANGVNRLFRGMNRFREIQI